MHIILQKENNGWAHKTLIAVLLSGFVTTALNACGDIATNLPPVKFGLVVSLPGGLLAQEMAANLKGIGTNILTEWCANIMFLIADTAIVWRAWALWAENRLIKWMLLIILLADIGGLFCVNIADAIVDTKAEFNLNFNVFTLDWLSTALNLTVNIMATLLIAYRAWTYHQSTCGILHNKTTQVEAILLLMVESGAIFGVIQVINMIFAVLEIHTARFSPVNYADTFLAALYINSAAFNPVALVILTQTGNSYEHSFHLEDVPSLEINSDSNIS
ncbi:hypothetical protein BT96DRAFT_1101852 [Gymnopus androsaceus JB14]|uniref:Uncharacterized protein n=1 Tax=Gymnopus androsaceus JB14 TaxID=1447944 RepID=A0A6A4GFH8_9AGAR|nr:hypothetical protein BT96DRAFT_1101852 [Gymnopus androsaceus JB14]